MVNKIHGSAFKGNGEKIGNDEAEEHFGSKSQHMKKKKKINFKGAVL